MKASRQVCHHPTARMESTASIVQESTPMQIISFRNDGAPIVPTDHPWSPCDLYGTSTATLHGYRLVVRAGQCAGLWVAEVWRDDTFIDAAEVAPRVVAERWAVERVDHERRQSRLTELLAVERADYEQRQSQPEPLLAVTTADVAPQADLDELAMLAEALDCSLERAMVRAVNTRALGELAPAGVRAVRFLLVADRYSFKRTASEKEAQHA